jgi:hypothetical protein
MALAAIVPLLLLLLVQLQDALAMFPAMTNCFPITTANAYNVSLSWTVSSSSITFLVRVSASTCLCCTCTR